MTGKNIGGESNNTLIKTNGSTKIQKIMEIGPATHQVREKEPIHQSRETAPIQATII